MGGEKHAELLVLQIAFGAWPGYQRRVDAGSHRQLQGFCELEQVLEVCPLGRIEIGTVQRYRHRQQVHHLTARGAGFLSHQAVGAGGQTGKHPYRRSG